MLENEIATKEKYIWKRGCKMGCVCEISVGKIKKSFIGKVYLKQEKSEGASKSGEESIPS